MKINYIPNRVIDADGIADGASVFVYYPGTTTPIPLYIDAAFTTPVGNPYVVAAGAAVPPLYANATSIRVKIVTATGTEDYDPYDPLSLGTLTESEVIYLKNHGIVADGVTVNSAAAVETLIAAVPGVEGCILQYPMGHTIFDRRIVTTGRRVIHRGYGDGTSTSYTDGSAGTLLEFPAGQTGFRIYPTAQNSRVEDMRIIQTSLLSTSQLGSYTAGSTTITLAAAGDFQNGQVIQLDGAGKDVVIQGRLFSTTNGSPTITWTDADGIYRGNSPGYIGMAISGTGIPAGATIASWGVGTMTISANATATNSGLLLTITTPIITEIVSGGGTTTLTIADIPDSTKTVTNRKVSHAAPAIYSTIQCNTRNLEAFGCQVGMCLHGITTGNTVADAGNFYSSYFGGSKFGVSLQGTDSQVNRFFGCNFAGPEIGVLEQSYLGNYFYGCHFAFNMGILVSSNSSVVQLIGGYFETGTSYIAKGGGTPSYALAFGVLGLIPGYGWEGFASYNGNLTTRALTMLGPISAKDDGTGLNYAASFDGGFRAKGAGPAYFTGNAGGLLGGVGTTSGILLGNSGSGTGGINVLGSMDNQSSYTLRELSVQASTIRFGNTYLGSQFGTFSATGLAAVGTVTGSNLSGTNTGDQTITLTGGVTGSGTGSFATTVASVPAAAMPALTGDVTTSAGAVATTLTANIVTYAKFQQVAASSLVGNATGSLANATGITLAGGLTFSGSTLTAAGALTPTSLASTGAVTSSSATAGLGYATGAGGAITQITSRTTGVTLSKVCGAITLVSAAGSATWNTFTVTNTTVAATDTVEVCQKSGANLYNVIVTAVGAGSFNLSVSAVSGTATESPVFNFVVTKAVAS